MSTSRPIEIMEKHRADLTRVLENMAGTRNELTAAAQTPAGAPELCYDNRHPKSYYLKFEQQSQKLRRQKNLSLQELEIVINQALGSVYYGKFYTYHERPLIENYEYEIRRSANSGATRAPAPQFPHRGRYTFPGGMGSRGSQRRRMPRLNPGGNSHPFRGANSHGEHRRPSISFDLALYYIRIKPSWPDAEKYLKEAQAAMAADDRQFDNERQMGARLYDHLSLAAEEQGRPVQACKYLTAAIRCNERHNKNQYTLKYAYIKRARLHRRLGAPVAALNDLDRALAQRGWAESPRTFLDQDELIHWERAKIFIEQKDFAAARSAMHQLRIVCQLNYKLGLNKPDSMSLTELGALFEAYEAAFPVSKRPPRLKKLTNYQGAGILPERRANWHSFDVNVKCPIYLEFIAQKATKAHKTPTDWAYLVSYTFALSCIRSNYENLIAPVDGEENLRKNEWWVPGVRLLFHRRDYSAAAKFFAENVDDNCKDYLGYELGARALMLNGEHTKALKFLTPALDWSTNYISQGKDSYGYTQQLKIYRYLAGICYAKTNQPAEALKEFTAGIDVDKSWPDSMDKIDNLLCWERARLHLKQGDYESGVGDLMKIQKNNTVKKYLASMITK